jgi:hypothetical protein
MNTNIEVLRELDELVEAARLLGVAQAKKGFGCYTDEDSRFERAMYESIDKHRAALLDWAAKQPAPRQPAAPDVEALVEALRSILGWRELRSGNDFPVERIEEIARAALAAHRKEGQPLYVTPIAAQAAENERLRAEVERLRGLVVSRFDQDGPPTFRQGAPEHELEDPVTAEQCAWFVTEISRLRAEVERLNRILGRIVAGDGDSTLTIRMSADAFAAAREYLLRDQKD